MSPELRKRMEKVAGGYSKYLFKWGNDDKAYCDFIKGAQWMHENEVVPLAEALRKAIIWAECVSARVSDKSDLNWRYLNEAREVLRKMKGGEG